ncbi:regulator of g protein signaling [Anaeramoeba flamelloides]|uniref:Regulator of g protein signaling n=1 Tax=Anaeramoeba flamelloides TaxID=1746091 RepID=A0AAV8ACY0_9EUKA|nr:regulator of g protein signaling [Anaeramoeba flamelloides]
MANGYKSDSKSNNITEMKTINGNKNQTENEGIDFYLDTLNIDVKVKEIEKNFFQKKSRLSEKFIIKVLIIQVICYNILFIILYFGSEFKDQKVCSSVGTGWGRILHLSIVYTNIFIFLFSTFLIRNIKENLKLRREIFMTTLILIAFIFIVWLPKLSDKVDYHYRWSVLYLALFHNLLIFGFPLYLSYKFESSKRRMEETNDKQAKNTYQKFIDIIEDQDKVQYIIQFSKKNYSVENILFYRTIKSFQNACKSKKKKNQKKIFKMMNSILNTFIMETSPLVINLSSGIRENTIQKCQTILNKKNMKALKKKNQDITNKNKHDDQNSDENICNIFDEALEEILNLMYTDTYPQFIQSKIYFEMIMKVGQHNPDQILTNNYNIKNDDSTVDDESNDDDDDDDDDEKNTDNHYNKEEDIEIDSIHSSRDNSSNQSKISNDSSSSSSSSSSSQEFD